MNIKSFFDTKKTVIYINRKPLEEFRGNNADIQHLFLLSESLIHLDSNNLCSFPNLKTLTIEGVVFTDYHFLKSSTLISSICLKKCHLTIIPSFFNTFLHLEYINLESNKIVAITNIQWHIFPKLKYLNLGNNLISSLSYTQIWFSNITDLSLCRNPIKSLDLPANLNSKIKTLKLSGIDLTEIHPNIGYLKNLEKLQLSSTKITNLPDELILLNKLVDLDIAGSLLEKIPEVIFKLSSLEVLNLDWIDLSNLELVIPSPFNYTLKTLSIGFCSLKTIPKWVQLFPNIIEIYAHNNPIETIPEWLSEAHFLYSIQLSEETTVIEDELPSTFNTRTWSLMK